MSVTVRIPTPLRRVTNGQDKVSVEGSTLDEVIESLHAEFPGIKERICDDQGELRNFVNVYTYTIVTLVFIRSTRNGLSPGANIIT